MAHLGLSETEFQEIADAFRTVDTTADGFIDIDELEEVLVALGEKPTTRDMNFIMSKLDIDGSGRLDFQEFLPFVTPLIKNRKFHHIFARKNPHYVHGIKPQPKSVGTRRGVVNYIPFIIGITVPWAIFGFVYSSNSLRLFFDRPRWVFALNFILLFATVYYTWYTKRAFKLSVNCFIGGMCVFYVCMGWLLGNLNFWTNMYEYYELTQMATYVGVNPSKVHQVSSVDMSGSEMKMTTQATTRATQGKRYQDAGKIWFGGLDVGIDVTKTMSFKNGDTYCVAPIVDHSCKSGCGYDFWAVGVNCCGSDDQISFKCNGFNSGGAMGDKEKSAVRWIDEYARPFFRLAVIEAEGIHKIRSQHPLFFMFYADGENPNERINAYARRGYANVFGLMLLSFFSNVLIMVGVAKHFVTGKIFTYFGGGPGLEDEDDDA